MTQNETVNPHKLMENGERGVPKITQNLMVKRPATAAWRKIQAFPPALEVSRPSPQILPQQG